MEAYLLGTCERDLADRMDERLFSDDAFYEQMQEVKTSLIAREFAGTLPVHQLEQFNLQRARSPHLDTEVKRARERQSQDKFPIAQMPSRISPSGTNSYRMFRVFGLVTASLLVPIGVTFIVQTATHDAGRSKPTIAANLAPVSSSPRPEAGTTGTTISIFLPASVLRGESNMPVLHVRDAARPVELQMEIRGQADTGSAWSVVLYRGSLPILNLHAIKEKAIERFRYASIPLPAGTLAPGIYQLLLIPEGPTNDLAGKAQITRSFRVI